ncbi:MAG: NgoMIV family type II restriction endonuclease [Anaerolineales bacterium]
MNELTNLRMGFHRRLINSAIYIETNDLGIRYPNFADSGKKSSVNIAWGIVNHLGYPIPDRSLNIKVTEENFENTTRDFLQSSFDLLLHLRPGEWHYSTGLAISEFDQYEHLAEIERLVKGNAELATALGKEYIIAPDIVVGRFPVKDAEINSHQQILSSSDGVATFTPLRSSNFTKPHYILHASISCKWTFRSDRGQNARTEALNLIRHRKGHLPHIVAVTAEPLPTRIASLALGTGDLDCVYHFALHEMKEAIRETGNEDQMDMLDTLIVGRRLRDISDLPFDLAI